MKIKGNILISRREFVVQRFGQHAWEAIVSTLPEADQAVFAGLISSLGWYSFDLGRRLDQAIVDQLGNGDFRVFEHMGIASAEQNLSTVHKLSIEHGNPQGFLGKSSVLYRFYYDVGRREYTPTGPTSGVITTYDAETYSTADCMTVIGWYKQALKMCGAQDVVMLEEVCRARGGQFCRYTIAWKMKAQTGFLSESAPRGTNARSQ